MTSPRGRPTQAERNQAFLDVEHLKVGLLKRTTRAVAIVMGAQMVREVLTNLGQPVIEPMKLA